MQRLEYTEKSALNTAYQLGSLQARAIAAESSCTFMTEQILHLTHELDQLRMEVQALTRER